jgi:murein DD-endopeptidase MepM/ murein hydrolase activator NlpD
MKKLILIFLCGFSLCNAQQIELARDSILSTKDTVSISIKNNIMAPVFFIIDVKDSTMQSIIYEPRTIIPAKEKLTNFIKVPRNILESDSAAIKLGNYFTFNLSYGDPKTAKPDTDYQYLLPYKRKKKLVQGNFGRFSHNHKGSFHAFDFGTKIGDTIYAARDGKVIATKKDSKKFGRSRKFSNFANYIVIIHDDGTTAWYYHLDFEGVLIKEGDQVKRGQAIGISGMTGFTTTPHLHFVVRKPTEDQGNISIPIEFEGYVGKKFKQGKRYARRRK